MNILVTGANGFIGSALCQYLSNLNFKVYAVVRKPCNLIANHQFVIPDLLQYGDWEQTLSQIDVVIHTAGLAHVKGFADHEYFKINTEMTKKLALECSNAKVKRFIYLSSVTVYGEGYCHQSIDLLTPFQPKTAYAHSKILAEQLLLELHEQGKLNVTILRLPLVYGSGVKGNIKHLMNAIRLGFPFPFKEISNNRSLVYIDNLCDVIVACLTNSKGAGKAFLVSDDEDISIVTLIQLLANGMNKNPKLFKFPLSVLRFMLKLVGKEHILIKLIGSFQVDISHTKQELNWKPKINVRDGLIKTGQSFIKETRE